MLHTIRHRLIVLFGSALLLLSAPAEAQWVSADAPTAAPPERVEDILARYERTDTPGAAVAVVVDGELAYTNAFGLSDLEHGTEATPESAFYVASLAKQVTAFAIAMLADQGQLSLDADIRTYLPEVPDFSETITVRHLVHHTSGLRDAYGMLALAGWRSGDPITTEDILRVVSRFESLDQTPGDLHLYSNTNYTLLAEIVARVTGQPFADWVEAHLFRPLGMARTRFVADPETLVPNRVTNYAPLEGGGFARQPAVLYDIGPGGLYSTAPDLAAWTQNLMTGRVGGEAVIREIREVGVLNDGTESEYAFGLGVGDHNGLMTLGHGGSAPGTQSTLRVYPAQRFAVIVLSNAGGTLVPAFDLSREIASFYLRDQMQEVVLAPSGGRRAVMITTEDLAATPVGSYEADPSTYDRYEGTYLTGSGDLLGRLIVSRDGDRLLLAMREPPGIPLAPTGEHQFLIPQLNFGVTFHVDPAGDAESLTLNLPGRGGESPQALTGVRQDREPPTIEELQTYAGTYYSAELDTFYRVSAEAGHLVVRHQRHGSIPLRYLAPDEFLADTRVFTSVSFGRDESGRVAEVYLTGYSWSSGATLKRISSLEPDMR